MLSVKVKVKWWVVTGGVEVLRNLRDLMIPSNTFYMPRQMADSEVGGGHQKLSIDRRGLSRRTARNFRLQPDDSKLRRRGIHSDHCPQFTVALSGVKKVFRPTECPQ